MIIVVLSRPFDEELIKVGIKSLPVIRSLATTPGNTEQVGNVFFGEEFFCGVPLEVIDQISKMYNEGAFE